MRLSDQELQELARRNAQIQTEGVHMPLGEFLAQQQTAAPRPSPKPTRKKKGSRTAGKGRGKQDRDYWINTLLSQIRAAGLPAPHEVEYRFHPTRQWRFDMMWKLGDRQVACEVDGGIWMQTRSGRSKGHAHPERFLSDLEKFAEAALHGWLVIRVAPEMIQDGRALDWLIRALRP